MKGKTKSFDAVKMMRMIRDRMSEEMKGMTPSQQIDYIRRANEPVKKWDEQQPVSTANG